MHIRPSLILHRLYRRNHLRYLLGRAPPLDFGFVSDTHERAVSAIGGGDDVGGEEQGGEEGREGGGGGEGAAEIG